MTWSTTLAVDGFYLDAKMEGGVYQRLTSEPLPPNTIGGRLDFEYSTPERTTFFFLLSAYKNGAVAAQSEVQFRRSLRPVVNVTLSPQLDLGGAAITWDLAYSTVATGARIERGNGQGGWNPLEAPVYDSARRRFFIWDGPVSAAGGAQYRVFPTAGGESGMPCLITLNPILQAPVGLTANRDPSGGWKLAWSNLGNLAKSLEVVRRTWTPGNGTWSQEVRLATLPPGETSFTDISPPALPRIAYQVVARSDTHTSESTWCLLGGPDEFGELGMTRAVAVMPFPPKLRTTDGAWLGWFKSTVSAFQRVRVLRHPSTEAFPRDVRLFDGANYNTNYEILGTLGAANEFDLACWGSPTSGSSDSAVNVQFHHLLNGAWQAKPSIQISQFPNYPSFSSDRILRWLSLRSGSTSDVGLASLGEDGQLHWESLSLLGTGPKSNALTGAAGRLHMFAQSPGGWGLATRPPDGSWSLEAIVGTTGEYWSQHLASFTDPQGGVHAVFRQPSPTGLRYLQYFKPSGGLPVLTEMFSTGNQGWGTVYSFCHSDDWSRLGFVLLDDAGHLQFAVRSANGLWTVQSILVPDGTEDYREPLLMSGFLKDNRFWVAHDEVSIPVWNLSRRFVGQYLEVLTEK